MNHTDSFWTLQNIRAVLEDKQRRINEEIRSYPPPIPRCDAQFNALLEERAAVAQALYDLDVIAHAGDTPGDQLGKLCVIADAISGEATKRLREAASDI